MSKATPGRLRQVLINLIENAIKFTPKGSIALKGTGQTVSEDGVEVLFSVKDTGIGIPPEKQDQLFENFYQVDASDTRKYGGTGLGLAICRQIVALMGGNIRIKSEPGTGSEFLFNVHLNHSEKAMVSADEKDIRGLKILYLDEDEAGTELMRRQLESWKIKLQVAPNGLNALSMLKKAASSGIPFDIAMLDAILPDMDAQAFCRRIQADNRLLKTSLIMLTTSAKKGDAKFYQELGFSAYFPKPVNFSDLFNCFVQIRSRQDLEGGELITRHSIKDVKNASCRLLLVEDNPVNQKVASGMLSNLGFHADIVSNGQEALKFLTTTPCDLVFMDCQMPEMDGYEATRMIRDPDSGVIDSNIPIVAMTAGTMAEDKKRCIDCGMNDYIAKPVDIDCLWETLKKWVVSRPAGSSQPFYVLVVEDNSINLRITASICKRMKWVPDAAVNGLQAIEMLSEKEYDLVLMDCQMPEMDGYEATRVIRDETSDVRQHDILIIAVTANVSEENRQKCMAAGMNEFLTKPLKLRALRAVVQDLAPHLMEA